MISLAWSISLLLCIPQAVIFQGDSCKAHFEGQNSEDYPNWGLKTYIIWFSLSNFFIPLVILFYCYTRICYVIWENGKQRRDFSPVKDESTSDNCFKVLTRFAQWDILLYNGYFFSSTQCAKMILRKSLVQSHSKGSKLPWIKTQHIRSFSIPYESYMNVKTILVG